MQKRGLGPIVGSLLIFAVAQALTFLGAYEEKIYLQANEIELPQMSFTPVALYFFGMVVLIGIVLWLIPVTKLKWALRVLFAAMFLWGLFLILYFLVPVYVALPVAAVCSLAWLLRPKIWLHNLLLIFALGSLGFSAGALFAPWTVILLLLALSIYDVLAVRFGYMLWMATKLSDNDTLPAFVIPLSIGDWTRHLGHAGRRKLAPADPGDRKFSVLGGGDIGFPLLFVGSVFAVSGFGSAFVVAAFQMAGIVSVFWIQAAFLKGKPMPALPPMFIASLIGFLVTLA